MDATTRAETDFLRREARLFKLDDGELATALKSAVREARDEEASVLAARLRLRALQEILAASARVGRIENTRTSRAVQVAGIEDMLSHVRDDRTLEKIRIAERAAETDEERDKLRIARGVLGSKSLGPLLRKISDRGIVGIEGRVMSPVVEGWCLGYLAGCYADAERIFAGHQLESRKSLYDAVGAETKRQLEPVARLHLELQAAYSLGDPVAAADVGVRALTWIEAGQRRMANLRASVALGGRHAAERAAPASERRWAASSLEVHRAFRETVALGVASAATVVACANPALDLFAPLARAAARLRHSTVVEDGRNTTLREVVGPSPVLDKLIELTGFVRDVETFVEAENKTSSAFTLYDRGTDRAVRVIAPFRQVRYAGVTNGAYARVHARAYVKSDQTRLRLDVANLSEASAGSWRDRLNYELRRAFSTSPAGLNILVTPVFGRPANERNNAEILRIGARY